MPEPFDAIEYLAYLRAHWRFAALAIGVAGVLTALGCWIAPARYTATATLVIEPPAGADPRTAIAVSPIYLESLKTYEEFASSDTLFAKAAGKFHLERFFGGSIESLKRSVLSVSKPKDTKILQIEVTLPDAQQAQAVAQYLAEETVALNRSIATAGEGHARAQVDAQVERARANLDQARNALAAVESARSVDALEEEVRSIADLRTRTAEQLIAANAWLAELSARPQQGDETAAARARVAALNTEKASLDRESAVKAAALAALRARLGRADDEVRAARTVYDRLAQRSSDLAASSGQLSEQIRIIDPGVVPQRPSFPKPALFVGAALLIAAVLSLAHLTLRFGLSGQRARFTPPELKVARGGR
jgi:uncharacterized protein involved in exopolysaccharide biosynthesis